MRVEGFVCTACSLGHRVLGFWVLVAAEGHRVCHGFGDDKNHGTVLNPKP